MKNDSQRQQFPQHRTALGITFADLAKRYKETGNAERFEISKRNAQAALDAIDHFKGRLTHDLRVRYKHAELS